MGLGLVLLSLNGDPTVHPAGHVTGIPHVDCHANFPGLLGGSLVVVEEEPAGVSELNWSHGLVFKGLLTILTVIVLIPDGVMKKVS